MEKRTLKTEYRKYIRREVRQVERNFVENVPYCIYIKDIPIPTYQTMWDENRKLREQISRLKKITAILWISMAAFTIALFSVQ